MTSYHDSVVTPVNRAWVITNLLAYPMYSAFLYIPAKKALTQIVHIVGYHPLTSQALPPVSSSDLGGVRTGVLRSDRDRICVVRGCSIDYIIIN